MEDLKPFNSRDTYDTWWKSGRVPKKGEPQVTWKENETWLRERFDRGDKFQIATNHSSLPPVRGGFKAGVPNAYFTARELDTLTRWGAKVEYTPRP